MSIIARLHSPSSTQVTFLGQPPLDKGRRVPYTVFTQRFSIKRYQVKSNTSKERLNALNSVQSRRQAKWSVSQVFKSI